MSELIYICSEKQADLDSFSFQCCILEAEEMSVQWWELCFCCRGHSLHFTSSHYGWETSGWHPLPPRTALWGGGISATVRMTEDEQVAQWVGWSVCAVERGRDVAFGIWCEERRLWARFPDSPPICDRFHTSGACDRLFLVVKRI